MSAELNAYLNMQAVIKRYWCALHATTSQDDVMKRDGIDVPSRGQQERAGPSAERSSSQTLLRCTPRWKRATAEAAAALHTCMHASQPSS